MTARAAPRPQETAHADPLSRAALAVTPLQDVLRLGNEARMNLPGSEGGTNWKWRYGAKALTADLAAELQALTERSRRC